MAEEISIEMGDEVKDKASDFQGIICATITTTESKIMQVITYHPKDTEKKFGQPRERNVQVRTFNFNVLNNEGKEDIKLFAADQLELIKKGEKS